jgi:diguanylate cyclase (GGDEF)-like protein/PAS domain S-box-containing protein
MLVSRGEFLMIVKKNIDKTLKYAGISISVLSLISMMMLAWFIGLTGEQYKNVNTQWLKYSIKEQAIVDSVMNLSAELGYGGMIHHFKNYLIRGDQMYLKALNDELKKANIELAHLKTQLTSAHELQALKTISDTIEKYFVKSQQLTVLLNTNVDIKSMDNELKVNDIPALAALALLKTESLNRLSIAKELTNVEFEQSELFLKRGKYLSAPFLFLYTLLLYFMYQLHKSYNKEHSTLLWLKSIINSTPDSVLITDGYNNIVMVNKTATEFFGYTHNALLKMHIDELVFKEKDFFPSVLTLNETTNYAKISTGKKVPVDINLSKIDSDKQHAFITTVRDITSRKLAEEKIRHQANYDSLTDIPNRMLFNQYLMTAIIDSKANNKKFAVLFIDLDNFKKINDTMGHEVGDNLLIDAASRLNKSVRQQDIVSRLGGDEFLILLNGFESESEITRIVVNILAIFRETFHINNRKLFVTASIGVSIYPENGVTESELIRNADTAMYHAKSLGSNIAQFYNYELSDQVKRKLVVEEQIYHGIQNNEFSIAYQPKVKLSDSSLIGFEALLRWNNDILGVVMPDEFIPIAEQTGLIIPLGKFVIEQVIEQISQLKKANHLPFKIALNISPVQLKSITLVALIRKALTEKNISGKYLEIEITESVMLSENDVTNEILKELKALGISLAMDDFGTGYSSLNYLRKIQFDILKIDKSFISGIPTNQSNYKLISATIAIAKSFNLQVVAEGIETEEQAKTLLNLGCDFAQGYYYHQAKPMSHFLQDSGAFNGLI